MLATKGYKMFIWLLELLFLLLLCCPCSCAGDSNSELLKIQSLTRNSLAKIYSEPVALYRIMYMGPSWHFIITSARFVLHILTLVRSIIVMLKKKNKTWTTFTRNDNVLLNLMNVFNIWMEKSYTCNPQTQAKDKPEIWSECSLPILGRCSHYWGRGLCHEHLIINLPNNMPESIPNSFCCMHCSLAFVDMHTYTNVASTQLLTINNQST